MIPETPAAVLFTSLIKLFFLSAVGYGAVRIRILPIRAIEALSKFVINVTLPVLIIVTMGQQLDLSMIGIMGLGVAVALALNGGSLVLAFIARRGFIPKDDPARNSFVSLSAIQNAGYLPIPLVTAVLPEELQAYGLLLVFFYMLVMNPLFWSVGVWLITGGSSKDWRASARNAINPPLIALSLGLLFLVPQVKATFTSLRVVTDVMTIIGNATIPLVLIILGGSFGEGISLRGGGVRFIAVSTVIKMIIVPVSALSVVKLMNPEYVFGLVLILEASMPAAMNHIVVARGYGGDVALISRTLFVHYALSVVTVPFFLYLGT